MPVQMWKHNCSRPGSAVIEVRRQEEVCPICSQRGEYDGWHYTAIEKRAMYQRLTGLPASGPHRMLLPELVFPCEQCSGEGLINVDILEEYYFCPDCNGTGGRLLLTEEEMEEVRRWVQDLLQRGRDPDTH